MKDMLSLRKKRNGAKIFLRKTLEKSSAGVFLGSFIAPVPRSPTTETLNPHFIIVFFLFL